MNQMTPAELKFLETEIEQIRLRIGKTFQPDPREYYESEEDRKDLLAYFIRRYYLDLSAYFESKQLPLYAKEFKQRFNDEVNDDQKVLEEIEHDGESYLHMMIKLNVYTTPFKGLSTSRPGSDGIDKLIDILSDTPTILKRLDVNPNSEAEIYNAVKWVLNLYYDARPTNGARFLGKLKTYKPDILIPELQTAIEYKLSKARKTVEEYIDQLIIDAKNYKGDIIYEKFIAVLCIKDRHTSLKEIRTAWHNKNFNKRWTLVIVNV